MFNYERWGNQVMKLRPLRAQHPTGYSNIAQPLVALLPLGVIVSGLVAQDF